ncbi:MAG: hypothetical protein B0D92_07395 [Spirochaeta sp. LUC14_002_19_P3]|nr:MAG: hypothetical protein B0D92_07395 [Spirochaeta sp. LUC14_002_19_P3]
MKIPLLPQSAYRLPAACFSPVSTGLPKKEAEASPWQLLNRPILPAKTRRSSAWKNATPAQKETY